MEACKNENVCNFSEIVVFHLYLCQIRKIQSSKLDGKKHK